MEIGSFVDYVAVLKFYMDFFVEILIYKIIFYLRLENANLYQMVKGYSLRTVFNRIP